MENSIRKSISTINPAIPENTECSIEAHTPGINQKEGLSLDHSVYLPVTYIE